MAVQVGQTLDKYELLERVGQGGMAIVYRGRDNSLRREVAVKVLHQHLAEHREARERFEREAHAVAKLRHENILEIYDFSGTESDESYIVTEFIDGQSLKEFITDHAIHYPEVGAMITMQVCKALQHAHAHGILHRDVKPENVMIRSDGVVKLTDFGIAQMIDLQRLTVTGQLLGSPAYMSPEHVNGGQLDFRTDVFALGIMLYQLVTGELPFKGKNPHEILKRIAEGDFLDPSVVNPHVGKDLRRIIRKSMARDKEDRYADVSLMLAALETFLASSGISSVREDLARYFDAPVPYEMALKERLVEHLTRTGKTLLAAEQPAALEAFNRVLTLQPDHSEVLTVLDQLGARRKRLRILGAGLAACLVLGLAFGAREVFVRSQVGLTSDIETPAYIAAPVRTDAASVPVAADARVVAATELDATAEVAPPPDAREVAVAKRVDAATSPLPIAADASFAPSGEPRAVTISVYPWVNSEYRINKGGWTAIGAATRTITVPPGEVLIEARNTGKCCKPTSKLIPASATDGRRFSLVMPFLPATVTARCSVKDVVARVNKQRAQLGSPISVRIGSGELAGKRVEVVFFSLPDADESFYQKRSVTLVPGDRSEVVCAPN